MKKEASGDEVYFQEMLKVCFLRYSLFVYVKFYCWTQVTSSLRKEQEEEVRIHERMREHRHTLNEADQRSVEASRRLTRYTILLDWIVACSFSLHTT